MSRGKKIAKWTGICLAIAIFIVCLPFLLLRMALSESVSNKILETVVPDFANAEARIGHIDYALLSSWPDVELGIKDITVISKVFEPADTLLHIDSIGVSVNAGDFLNYGDIRINRLHVDDPHFYIKRSNGKLNAGILLPSDTAATDTAAFAMPDIFLGNLAAPYQNAGEVRNRGWDWAVNYQDMKGDWAWNAGFYISHVKNEILKMGNLDEVLGSNTINRVGYPINSYFGYKSLGIYKTQADVESRLSETGEIVKQNGQIPSPGDIIYEDTNNDGNITAEDRQIIGNPFPDFSYGFTIGVSWKNLDLTMLWQGVAGIYRYSVETTSDIRGNFTDRWYDRWSEENPDGKMPRLGNTFNNQYSSFWLEKADYLRLKNLEIGYNFRQRGLEKAGISSIRVYLSGTNLLTFTPMENWDPEKSSGDYNNNVSPSMRTYSIGLNISF